MGTIGNVKVEPVNVSWGASALGFCDGDIEVTFEEQMVDVTAHQEGTNVLSALRTGKSAEISLTMKETSVGMLQTIFNNSQASGYTPSGAGASAVIAWGGNRDFSSVLAQAQKLVLHPVVLGATDYSRDLAFWLAYPMPESVVFSGENPMTVAVTFKIFPDSTKASVARLGVYGNHTQDFA
jgi:hypothetical protein